MISMRDAKRQKWQLEQERDKQAGPHDILWTEDVGERATEPGGNRRRHSVSVKDKGHAARGKVQIDE